MISITFSGPDADRVLRLLREDDERRRAGRPAEPPAKTKPLSYTETMTRIIRALDLGPAADSREVFERAHLPKPWWRAGHVLAALRSSGRVQLVPETGYVLIDRP